MIVSSVSQTDLGGSSMFPSHMAELYSRMCEAQDALEYKGHSIQASLVASKWWSWCDRVLNHTYARSV